MSTAYSERRSAERLAARRNRPCMSCGEIFTPARATGRYCSPACRISAHRRGRMTRRVRDPEEANRRS